MAGCSRDTIEGGLGKQSLNSSTPGGMLGAS
jgi:hypothetical protein